MSSDTVLHSFLPILKLLFNNFVFQLKFRFSFEFDNYEYPGSVVLLLSNCILGKFLLVNASAYIFILHCGDVRGWKLHGFW
jgi:hypothetical protein